MNIVPHEHTVGVKIAVGSTASLGSILISLSSYIPGVAGQVFALLVPLISSIASWLGIYAYNRWMEPQAVVSWRAALKKDLAEQLAIINDSNCDDVTRQKAKEIYSQTKMKIATLRQDYASGSLGIKNPS